MTPFVPPVLDVSAYTPDQVAEIATELSRLVGLLIAENIAYLDRVHAATSADVIDGPAMAAALVLWTQTTSELAAVSTSRLAAFVGESDFKLH